MKEQAHLATCQQKKKNENTVQHTQQAIESKSLRKGSTLHPLTRGAVTGSKSKGQKSAATNQQSGWKGPELLG